MTTRKGRFFLVAAAFITLVPTAWCQRYSDWRIYRAADGMAESPCVSVTVGGNEKVLAKHINVDSISELNGYSVTSFASPEVGRSRVYGSSAGQLWTVSTEGLDEFRDGTWQLHPIPEIAALFRGVVPATVPPIPIQVIRQSRVLILLPDQLIEFNAENRDIPRTTVLRTVAQTHLQKFLGMGLARDGSLWISGARGLTRTTGAVRNLKPSDEWREFLPPALLQAGNFLQPLADIDADGVTCAADSLSSEQKLVAHFDGQDWTAQPMGNQKIRGSWRGPEGSTWVTTLNTLFLIDNSGTATAESEEFSSGHYFDVAVETNGIFWLASAEGLLRYSPPLWKSPRAIQRLNSLVPCLAEDSESRLWFVSGGALHSLEDGRYQEHAFPRNFRLVLQSARALLPLKNGDLLLDTGEQLFQFQPGADTFNSVPVATNEKQHALGMFRDGGVAVESTDAVSQKCRFQKYNGAGFQAFPATPPDCAASAFLETQNGDIWLGSENGPVWYHEKKWQTFSNAIASGPIISLVETAEGKVWCAAPDSIWEFDGQNWSIVRGGFDQINNAVRSHDGNIWVASNGGISRFIQGAWIENSIEEGLPNATARQVYEDRRGRIWAATTHGLTLFHPDVDPDPPQTRIRKEPEENSIPQNVNVILSFTGEDKWKYTPRERLLYSYRLDQRDWSPFAEANSVSYSDLSAGPHSLEVRAMDRNGNIEEKPARMAFAIALPWYRETRLVLISLAGMMAALFFAGLAFNRHRKLLRSYAEVEKKVAERTHQLEITSRELVHSQKMNALGTLAAGIAHDFNNILSIIKGSAQIIEDNVGNTEKVRTRVDRIKTVVEQGAGIVRAMLGFSAGTSEEPALCDLNTVVGDTIQLLGDRFQRDAAVLFKPAPGLPQIPVVKEFVQQILLNFVFNAAEAETAAKQKQIVLGLRRAQRLPENLALAPASAREYVLVSVQDFGCGISPGNLPRIFEPFFTTKALSARRGTGLGLSMVYELARKLEAGLGVDSVVGVGSTFTLILPVRNL
ncbi:MAG TPA: ATP-binding protein [Verrucomicrobiae bacterium]|jgi:signal transduction histidine kinase|nr:ATP-binding protein [Verrucomicrobiae bacterium]